MKLGLQARGFIVFAIPLVMQVGLVLWLSALMWRLEAEEAIVRQQRLVANSLHKVTWEMVDGIFRMHVNAETDGFVDTSTTAAEWAKFQRTMKSIRQHSWSPEQQQYVLKLKKVEQDLMKCLDWVQIQQSMGRQHWKKVNDAASDDIIRVTIALVNTIDALLAQGERDLNVEQARILESRAKIQAVLSWVAPVIFVFSGALIFIYADGVLKPLSRVVENSKRLAGKERLLPALQSEDEISILDRLLHSVSASVDEAFKRESAMLENASDLVCSLDGKLRFDSANLYAERMLGLCPRYLAGQNFLDFVCVQDRALVDQRLTQAYLDGQSTTFEAGLMTVDRTTIIDTRISLHWSNTQQKYFCVIHDVTEEKNMERLKQDFLDMISHDLRSPLMAIQGSMSLIAEGAKDPVSDVLKKDMEVSSANVTMLMNFVNDLLDLQHLQSVAFELDREEFDLKAMISEVVSLVGESARAKDVVVETPHGEWSVSGDRKKLSRAFMNLLTNAIKFSPGDSVVTIGIETGSAAVPASSGTGSAAAVDEGSARNAGNLPASDFLKLTVNDSGPGIPQEHRAKIFEPYHQTDEGKSREGSGLGLAISKLIVERHGGTIGVREGADGTGSTFWITLPVL